MAVNDTKQPVNDNSSGEKIAEATVTEATVVTFLNHNSNSNSKMPRNGRKGKQRQCFLSSSSDISIKDFADCPIPQACTRVKKSVIKATATSGVEQSSGVQVLAARDKEELDWFDKDLDSFDIPESLEDEEEKLDTTAKTSDRHRANFKKSKDQKTTKDEGLVYPADLWFHLSHYIHPQDIGRFAAICSSSNAITKTAGFWRGLYHRYYYNADQEKRRNLPDRLKPSGMEKLNGLRGRVICALFHLHDPLVDRTQTKGPIEAEPHDLTGYRCLLAWHQPGPRGWQFCFKLQKPSLLPRKRACKQDLYNGYNDIFDNPEEGSCVLQVLCCHFASVPPVMGLLLKQVYMGLSIGFRHHRLRLTFDSSMGSNLASASDTVAILDDVKGVKVMQWWNPAYPFTP